MIRRCRPPVVSFRCKRPLPRPTKLPRPVVDNAPFVLPINIRCNVCSQYIYQGTHLFVRKREVLDERYLDFECCLICLKCTNCSAEIRIKSDPENRDYIVESGATKKRQAAVSKKPNYKVAVSKKRKREAEEGGDELKSLENTTLGSKIEIAALDEMKSMEMLCLRTCQPKLPRRMIRRCRPPLVSFRCKRPLPRPTKLPRPVVDNAPFVLPINIRCNVCSQYIYQGTHLFVRKREVLDERYLDFECCLICLKCTNCSAEIRIKSDPENRDYIVESGATKKRQAAVSKKPNYKVAVSKKRKREAEEGGDELKSLENTTLGSKIEIAALDEMKSMEIIITVCVSHFSLMAVSADAMLEDLPAKAAKKDVEESWMLMSCT
ncbi:coiled-coil domain-containing protein 94 [Quercus suber]|uniref:Coiled-coil domain-containing protein 94 n=1 Tax=Quercus suber TaxID=58331 RepID=A0AAW0M6J2_QUESU